jgi:hypothetical protein
MKLLKEMPKITKCLKLRYSVDFIKLETQGTLLYYFSNFRFCIRQTTTVHKQTERSDTTILGNLGILVQFRHFPVYPG